MASARRRARATPRAGFSPSPARQPPCRAAVDHCRNGLPVTASSSPIRDYQSASDFLFGRINYERTPGVPYRSRRFKLHRMRQLAARLGHPEQAFPAIHIAGTKGKGSTAAMVASVLAAAGYRIGLYTSPHLYRLEERFVVDGRPCDEETIISLLARLQPIVLELDEQARQQGDPQGPTYFEITTAAALVHFRDQQVDAAVLEVGLGGRLDSTNICLPVVTAITSISFDHTRQLGTTLAAIAREKAGIIKPGIPLITGVTQPEPFGVIEQIARDHDAELLALGRDFDFDYLPHLPAIPTQPRCHRRLAMRPGLPGRGARPAAAIQPGVPSACWVGTRPRTRPWPSPPVGNSAAGGGD